MLTADFIKPLLL